MMETIRIRRAGYPIRHTFSDFIERYRLLVSGIKPPHMEECKSASNTICKSVLGGADFQLGKTKVFLKDAQDAFLEQERDRVLTKKLVAIQKAVRGWHYRRKFRKMKSSCVAIQRYYKGYAERHRYENVRHRLIGADRVNLVFFADAARVHAIASPVQIQATHPSLHCSQREDGQPTGVSCCFLPFPL